MAFHLYDITEVYSNASGTVQFIELFTTATGQDEMQGHVITVTAGTTNTFIFDHDLGSNSTANTYMLIATQGFADLGIVTPDYIVPNGFLFLPNGTINFANDWDILAYSNLPTDGVNSLGVSGPTGGHTTSVVDNSPTNFAGDTGHVDLSNADPEVGTPITDKLVGGGQTLDFSFAAFTDADGDDLTYTATLATGAALPGWLGFNADTRTFNGTPSASSASINVKVTASDGAGGTANDFFKIKVISGHVINGSSGDDTLPGTTRNDSISGLAGDDVITAGGGADTIRGAGGADSISGGGGNDVIAGGGGADTLAGGAGIDRFVYAEAPSRDVIQDFVGGTDKLQLDNAVYTAFAATGLVSAANVQSGLQSAISATSGDADAYLKFATNTGRLYYDADGSGPGLAKLIATLSPSATPFDPLNDVYII